jgi:hypothetical protein
MGMPTSLGVRWDIEEIIYSSNIEWNMMSTLHKPYVAPLIIDVRKFDQLNFVV